MMLCRPKTYAASLLSTLGNELEDLVALIAPCQLQPTEVWLCMLRNSAKVASAKDPPTTSLQMCRKHGCLHHTCLQTHNLFRNPKMDSRNDLICASRDRRPEDVQAILNQPRDLWDSQLGDSLSEAVCRSDPEIVSLLLSSGAKLDVSSFQHLLRIGDISILEAFLVHGWDLNSTEFGEPFIRQVLTWLPSYILTNITVYFIRVSVTKPDVISWLLVNGADPNVTNERGVSALGTTAIMPLVQGGEVIDALLSHGSRMEPDILHRCLRPTATGGPEVLKFFINKGADINHVTAKTGTPLHYAAFLGKEDEVRILLDAGADPSIVVNGETPASIANNNGHMHIYEMVVARSSVLTVAE